MGLCRRTTALTHAPILWPAVETRLLFTPLLSAGGWRGNTKGNIPRGMTVVDYYYLTGNKPNATVMVDVDRQGFVDLLADRLKFYA